MKLLSLDAMYILCLILIINLGKLWKDTVLAHLCFCQCMLKLCQGAFNFASI